MRRALLWLAWGSALAVLVAAIFLPNTGLAQLRSDFRWLSRSISWTEQQWPALDLIHVLMFAGLTVLARLTWPLASFLQIGSALVVVAAITEVVQLWVPGRRASWSDFGQDLIGIAAGLTVCVGAEILLRLCRQNRSHC